MNVQARLSLAISYLHLGDVSGFPEQPNLGNRRAALRHYRQSLALIKQVAEADTTNTQTQFLLGLVHERIERLNG
jgi:hypothetical protein